MQGACEILGFDPLYLANEGRFVAFFAAPAARRALDILGSHPPGNGYCLIGKVTNDSSPAVVMRSRIGATRIVDMLSGEQLPAYAESTFLFQADEEALNRRSFGAVAVVPRNIG